MMCEYSIRITGNHDILVLSPQIIGTLIEKIRCSDTKELDAIGDPTVADAILDRIVHTAHKIELTGDSVRKIYAKKK